MAQLTDKYSGSIPYNLEALVLWSRRASAVGTSVADIILYKWPSQKMSSGLKSGKRDVHTIDLCQFNGSETYCLDTIWKQTATSKNY